ncbi:hypothetical protein PIIN_08409 [Serendipita indica DSM 11827]|uniref:DRBM domain-containing protein n=1 Tax=Serendipita indica (strain DSM 11827) TaxID=1109443 RepID=G4TT13_SERID|nr:hypothetical protein PIIN_08409 [Serendipita indica DSM 11827]
MSAMLCAVDGYSNFSGGKHFSTKPGASLYFIIMRFSFLLIISSISGALSAPLPSTQALATNSTQIVPRHATEEWPQLHARANSQRQLLNQRIQQGWSAAYVAEFGKTPPAYSFVSQGPLHAHQWKASITLTKLNGATQVISGSANWHATKDAAKEDAATSAVTWLNLHYP